MRKVKKQQRSSSASSDESEQTDRVDALKSIVHDDIDPGGPLRKATSEISIRSNYSES